MTTHRTNHNKHNPYVVMNKEFLDNNALSAKAKGILSYLLSRPDGWETQTEQLISAMRDGRDSILSGLKELEKHGYFVRYPVKDETTHKILYWVKDVYESPVLAEQSSTTENKAINGKAVGGKAVRGKAVGGKAAPILNKELESTEKINNESVINPPISSQQSNKPKSQGRKKKADSCVVQVAQTKTEPPTDITSDQKKLLVNSKVTALTQSENIPAARENNSQIFCEYPRKPNGSLWFPWEELGGSPKNWMFNPDFVVFTAQRLSEWDYYKKMTEARFKTEVPLFLKLARTVPKRLSQVEAMWEEFISLGDVSTVQTVEQMIEVAKPETASERIARCRTEKKEAVRNN